MGPPAELPGVTPRLPGGGDITVTDLVRTDLVPMDLGGVPGANPLGGGISAFSPGMTDLIGTAGQLPADNPLFRQPLPSVSGEPLSDPHTEWTRPDLGNIIPGVLRLVGWGAAEEPTRLMPRDQLNELLREIRPEVIVDPAADPDATGRVDMTAAPESLPLAARMSPARVRSGTATPSIALITDALTDANRIMHGTGRTMPQGESGPPIAARWHITLQQEARNVLSAPRRNDAYSQLVIDAAAATDPNIPGNVFDLSRSVRETLARLGSDYTLTDADRAHLEESLSSDMATLNDRLSTVHRWESYLEERTSVDRTMDHALARFASPFGQDFVRFNLEGRVARNRAAGESWEDAFVRVTGSAMTPASPFPSRVVDVANFVSPSDGSDLSAPWASQQHGVRIHVDGDPAQFAQFVVDTVNRGGSNVMVGPTYTTELIDAIHHDPVDGSHYTQLEMTVEDVSTPAILRSWETAHARIDPANPNRVIVTESVPVYASDGSAIVNADGSPVTREMTFFVEVNGS